jgi:undecaprenyl-diphosphatase
VSDRRAATADGAPAPTAVAPGARTVDRRTATGWPPPQPDPGGKGRVALRLGLGAVAVTALLLGIGAWLGHLSPGSWAVQRDQWLDAWLAARRTSLLDAVTWAGSGSANTQTAIAVAAVAFFALRWWLGRWYESWVVVAAIVGELWIFLVVTFVIERARPDVPRLDVAPPTSSYPSGHTGAAVALYGCLAYLLVRYARNRALALTAASLLWLVPFAVGASRLYRGMHFPSDVLAGALGGGLWLLVVLWALMPRVREP